MFDAVGGVTWSGLVEVKVGASESKTAPQGTPSASCPVFQRTLLFFAVNPGDGRLALKSGGTADIPGPPLGAKREN
jgi:hypothetical protein